MQIPFGLHIIRFQGGLGNQMFQYAFYLSLRHRFPFVFYGFDTNASEWAHYGYELDKIFHIDSRNERKRGLIMRKLERHHYVNFSRKSEEHYTRYCPHIYDDIIHPHDYVGFWQSENYFISIEKQIRKTFQFREELLSAQTKRMAEDLRNSVNPISLHVRRGDYLCIDSTKTFGMEYYNNAVNLLRSQYSGGEIIVFSDDVSWVKENIAYNNIKFVDWNIGDDSWQDMYLMSQCTYNIIANSTFSWWGAWLNNCPNRKIIAPQKWMVDEPQDSNIIPLSWIRI